MDEEIKTQKSKESQAMQLQKERPSALVRDNYDTNNNRSAAEEAVKLAAIAINFNVRLRSSDMPTHMQEHALRCTRSLLDSSPATPPIAKARTGPNPTHIARALKKEFDSSYGPAWQCVVGASFGSFVTHSPGGFLYFSIDSFSVLLFKTEVKLVTET